MHQSLTVIITTFNEADNIARALDSVRWADEIIIVDSHSTDHTIEIAKTNTNKIFKRAYEGPADQKNWAIAKATHDWILILDADERATPELKEDIQVLLHQDDLPYDAYWIGRKNYFMGQHICYSGWQNDAVVRLIRKDKCRYNDLRVHEEIETEGIKVGRLHSKLEHFTFRNTTHFLEKMRRYAQWSAEDHRKKTTKVGWFHLFGKPFFRFFKHFVVQRGFLDGKVGFIISVIMAWGVFLRYLYLKEELVTGKDNVVE